MLISAVRAQVVGTEPKWRKFERIVAEIQKQIAPDAEITHNYTFTDEDGEKWQIDVLVEQKMGLLKIRTIIDCKDYTRVVTRERVEGFPAKMRAVNANAGIIISISGFSEGARKFAEKENFRLMEYREAGQADWEALLGSDAWMSLIRLVRIDNLSFAIQMDDFEKHLVPSTLALYDRNKHEIGSIKDRIEADLVPYLMELDQLAILPDIELESEVDGFFVKDITGNQFLPVRAISMTGDILRKVFTVNLRLAAGKVIVDSETNEKKYVQVISDSFNWKELFESQEGKMLSKEEFIELSKRSGKIFTFDVRDLMPYLRVKVTQRPQ